MGKLIKIDTSIAIKNNRDMDDYLKPLSRDIFLFTSKIANTYKLKDKTYDIKFDNILDLAIYVIPISIISARIYYILFKLDYYIQYPIEMFNFRNGGLAIYGGIIGGAITCYIYCKIKKIDFINLLDYIVVCLPLRTSNRKMG